MTKILCIILAVCLFCLGGCVGALVMHRTLCPPAYPGPGDWNGDGQISSDDFFAFIDEVINGPKYPEIVTG